MDPAAAGPFPKPRAFPNQGPKYTAGFENAFAARGDPTSPSATTNGRKTTGYVGQAARPPCQGFLGRFEVLRLLRIAPRDRGVEGSDIALESSLARFCLSRQLRTKMVRIRLLADAEDDLPVGLLITCSRWSFRTHELDKTTVIFQPDFDSGSERRRTTTKRTHPSQPPAFSWIIRGPTLLRKFDDRSVLMFPPEQKYRCHTSRNTPEAYQVGQGISDRGARKSGKNLKRGSGCMCLGSGPSSHLSLRGFAELRTREFVICYLFRQPPTSISVAPTVHEA
jgi:hypothetical protein